MKRSRESFFPAFLRKKQESYPYAAWDSADFRLPDAWKLGEDESLGRALTVFYAAGGYDFFEVVDADRYASSWLDFVGTLYAAIEEGVYRKGESHFHFPLPEEVREKLISQGIPSIFTTDF